MAEHHLLPSVETCHWGYFDATQAPALVVKSGDTVVIDTVTGTPNVVPDREKFHVPPALDAVFAGLKPEGPHILTGPVYVEGAKPGNVLEVRIKDVSVIQDWGFNIIVPKLGTLPHDYDEFVHNNIPIDLGRNVGIMPLGTGAAAQAVLRRHGPRPAQGAGAGSPRSPRNRCAATSTTRS